MITRLILISITFKEFLIDAPTKHANIPLVYFFVEFFLQFLVKFDLSNSIIRNEIYCEYNARQVISDERQ